MEQTMGQGDSFTTHTLGGKEENIRDGFKITL